MRDKLFRYLSKRFKVVQYSVFMYSVITFLIIGLLVSQNKVHYLVWLIMGLIFSLICYIYYKWLFKPYKEAMKVFDLFTNGYTVESLFKQPISLSPELEAVFYQFKKMINTNELISASKKQAQYLALQNQINPHFLYNTLEGIRGETLSAGLDSVAEMTEALATYFRYTISNVEHLVTLEDELKNIENYYIIQQYRFGERLDLKIQLDCESEIEIMHYRLPKLTLQPIVENSIYHGIERKIGKGHLRIKVEVTLKRLIITVSDDGLGMGEDKLNKLNEKLNRTVFECAEINSESKGGIAIINVNSRIKLLFGEEYGVCIYSKLEVGTDVEITLPLIDKV